MVGVSGRIRSTSVMFSATVTGVTAPSYAWNVGTPYLARTVIR